MIRTAILTVIVLLACGCRPASPPKLTDAVPPSATAIAGIDLAMLRTSPLSGKLPSVVSGMSAASKVLLVWNGRDMMILAEGAPEGYTPIASGISASGSSEMIATARSQLGRSGTGAPGLVEHAGNGTVWAVIHGDGRLPLTGNLANFFNLLRDADYTSLTADLRDPPALTITADCPTAEQARHFEGSLRAMVTMAAVASARQPEIAAQIRSFRVTRDDRTVHASGPISPEILSRLL